ncbi:hypothetical protein BKA81DRAFT_204696 [Phyllosticta paracitricarpa]|uniref:Uncharacterized protein n=1 Tax=Phyllosticta paracitricarpa TaxID=2016321 RepID=A0ABR1MUJ1_9PEZI
MAWFRRMTRRRRDESLERARTFAMRKWNQLDADFGTVSPDASSPYRTLWPTPGGRPKHRSLYALKSHVAPYEERPLARVWVLEWATLLFTTYLITYPPTHDRGVGLRRQRNHPVRRIQHGPANSSAVRSNALPCLHAEAGSTHSTFSSLAHHLCFPPSLPATSSCQSQGTPSTNHAWRRAASKSPRRASRYSCHEAKAKACRRRGRVFCLSFESSPARSKRGGPAAAVMCACVRAAMPGQARRFGGRRFSLVGMRTRRRRKVCLRRHT